MLSMWSGTSAIMNCFIFLGDFFHIFAAAMLFVGIIRRKSCAGISGRSLILFATSYVLRNVNIWSDLYSIHDMSKILLINLTAITVFLIYFIFKKTYQHKEDTFITELILIPAFLMSVWVNYEFTPIGIAAAFSVYLESTAILPQFYLILEEKQAEKSVIPYLVGMGLYKTMYLANWMYQYQTGNDFDCLETTVDTLYMVIFIVSIVECLFLKIKIVESARQNFF